MNPLQQIRIKSLNYRFTDSPVPIINNFSADICHGKVHAIIGRSGSGKSTLVKILSGLLKPESGSIEIKQKINHLREPNPIYLPIDHHFLLLNTCLVPQFIEYESFSVNEYINFGLSISPTRILAINQALSDFGANFSLDKNLLSMNMNSLSGGQRKILALAKTLFFKRPILILDEPTSGVDATSQLNIYRAFTEIASEKILLFSTHDNSYTSQSYHCMFKEISLD